MASFWTQLISSKANFSEPLVFQIRWELVFDSTTINARNGLRLPYSDKASMVVKDPLDKERIKRGELSKNSAQKAFRQALKGVSVEVRVTEERPSKAVGRIEFRFGTEEKKDQLIEAKWVANEKSYPRSESMAFKSFWCHFR